jgi:peptidyl-prolyl cis-trans isomerase SurA
MTSANLFPPLAYRKLVIRTVFVAAAAFAGGLAVQLPAQAQAVVAMVNTQPITSFDIEQRIRIAALVDRRRLDRKSALNELIDDQVKLIEARRVGYRVTDDGVEAEYVKLAKGNRQTEREFSDNLKKAGLQPNALRDKIRADLAWVVLLRDRQRKGSQITNAELESAVAEKRSKDGKITEYTLRQVLFIVPRGTAPGSRLAAANAARSRFTSCETGFDALRTLPDVALRAPIVRTSEDISKPLKLLLDKTPVDRMTAPAPTGEGLELVAVCGKKERENSNAQRSELAVELSEKKVTEGAKSYIAELRKKVDIKLR